MTPPTASPIPALLDVLQAWVAEHRQTIEDPRITAHPPRSIDFTARYRTAKAFEASSLGRHADNLRIQIRSDHTLSKLDLCITIAGPGYRHDAAAIALDDPTAAAQIADRIRTADDLRVELVRVMAERDEAWNLAAQMKVERDGYFKKWLAIQAGGRP